MDRGASRPRLPRMGRALPTAVSLVLTLGVFLVFGGSGGSAASAATHPKSPPPVVASGQPAPGQMNSATAVACGTATDCWVVGFGNGATAAIDATTNGGVTWHAQHVPSTVTVLAGISCFDAKHCMAVGATNTAGAVLITNDGGTSWSIAQTPAGAAALTAVDCTTKLGCISVVTDGTTDWTSVTNDLGTSWTRGGDLPPTMVASALTCPSPSTCLATGYAPDGPGEGGGVIATTADDGSTWTGVTLPNGVGVLRSVSCAGALCLAAGTTSAATTGYVPGIGQLLTSDNGGATWTIASPWVPSDDAYGVACPNAKTCVAVGTSWVGKTQPIPRGGIVSTLNGGARWRTAQLHYVPVGIAAVTCPIVDNCVAAGGNVLIRISLPVTPPTPRKTVRPGARPGAGVR
jgi:photosystem II stability/assembly factor-like uncharacterized protein